ncbi:SBBP repeat-containing protein, partial [candidate division TA06 bacterium]|nr:SBBP repeat-containing protein [candidate division TA06 bacterium]
MRNVLSMRYIPLPTLYYLLFTLFFGVPEIGAQTEWVARYNGLGNGIDEAHALTVDNQVNIYVTGGSNQGGIDLDYSTIKYDGATGDTLWVKSFNGPGNGLDESRALAVDTSGNVYVTGWSDSDTSIIENLDFVTIKYSSIGDTVWVRRYNGPGNGSDRASALDVDDSGNVYVTGWSTGIGTDFDYATIKYSSIGDTIWTRRYDVTVDLSNALSVDDSGNVYVTGNVATIKYSNIGSTVWVRGYAGNDLDIDDFGNVYITGTSGTIKFNSIGDTIWARGFTGNAITVDGLGNVYVTGMSGNDYVTIKYTSIGNPLWVRRYNGPGNNFDQANALALDAFGNVYVTGMSLGSSTSSD